MMRRRPLLLAGLAGILASPAVPAQQRASLRDPLRLGIDHAIAQSGLAGALQRSFGRDTGIAVQLVPGAALPLLDALERGELDATLTNTPQAELKLADQGLAHDRRAIAECSFAIVGPAPKGKSLDPAGINGGRDVAQALQALHAAAATPGSLKFLSTGDGSGTHMIEQAAWRAAGVAPGGDWYVKAESNGTSLAAQARAAGAYAIVERGVWADMGGSPLTVLVAGDPLLDAMVHYMRSFRLNHPAAKIFGDWIAGRKGARVVAAQRGYRPARR